MNESIELRNFINHEKDLNVQNLKLENKDIDKSEELDTDAMNKCIIAGLLFLIIFIIFSILAVKYVLNPNRRISNNNINKNDSNNQPNNIPIQENQNDKENEENNKPIDKDKEEKPNIEKEKPKEEEKPNFEKEKSKEEERLIEKERPNIEKPKENSDSRCNQYDPINLFSKRLKTKPITILYII